MKHFLFILVLILTTPALIFAQNFKIGDLVTNSDGSKGIVFYINADRTDGWMVALSDLQTNNWGLSDHITNINSHSLPNELLEEIDGFANTGLIRGYHFSNGYSASYGAGIVDYEKGWYIPTAGQLMKLCSVLDKVNDKLSLAGGSRLQLKPYFSSSEASYSAQVWAVDFGNSSHDWGGQFETHYKNESACFRAVRNIIFSKAPTIADINIPDSFCEGEPLHLQVPTTQFADSQGWQISSDENFTEPIAYNGQNIDFSFDGWFIRYFASNEFGTVYSNIVQINILPAPFIGEIQGETHYYYTDFGEFDYFIEPVEGAYLYDWSIDNPDWTLSSSSQSPSCTLGIRSNGVGTLTLKVHSECGVSERHLSIHHDELPDLIIFPNPTRADFTIRLWGMKGDCVIQIFDVTGRLIDTLEADAVVNGTDVPYSLKYKAGAMYLVRVANNNYTVTRKVVKWEP